MEKQYSPFAITAHCMGHPRKLFTPLTIMYIGEADEISAIRANAMWDTGAEVCLMSRELATLLKVDFKKTVTAVGLTGSEETPMGYVYVTLLNNGHPIDVLTGIVPTIHDKYSFILGLNFIQKGTLAISTTQFDTTLSFIIPTPGAIDFIKEPGPSHFATAKVPLSNTPEELRPRYGAEAMDLIVPDNKPC